MQGGSQGPSRSFETNTAVSVRSTVGNWSTDRGITIGFDRNRCRYVLWSDELGFDGSIQKTTNPTFSTFFCSTTA